MIFATLAIATTTSLQGYGGSTCGLNPCCSESCGRLLVGAELLYLRAMEGGLSSACDATDIIDTTDGGIAVSRLEGKAHDPDFKWHLGYRVGIGYEFTDTDCGIEVLWTHYDSRSHSKSDANKHNWNVDFNVVDLLYGCEYECSTCIGLTPFGGVRYATIDQKLNTVLLSTIDGLTSMSSIGHVKEDFFGVGPVFGVKGNWNFGCGFSLYGNVSVAGLYGTFHVRSNLRTLLSTGVNIDHLKSNVQACQAVVDAGFGIRWETCICSDKQLVVQLGLEQHRYFNFNQMCGYGDLNLDGVSLGIGLEF